MTATATTAQRGRAAVLGAGMAGLVGALTPVWWTHQTATRMLTSRRAGSRVEISRVDASTSIDEVLDRARPVIVEGLVESLGLEGVATRAGLAARVGDRRLDVAIHDAARPYFLYSGGYDAEVVDRRSMSFGELLDLIFDDGLDDDEVVYQLLGPRSLSGAGQEILDDVDAAIRLRCQRPTETRFSGVWIGSRGVVTPLHHDAWPGLLIQTEGTKRVTMYSPADRANLSFRNPLRGAGRWSDLPGRSSDADPADFPRLTHTVRHESVLRPGDALVVPSFWAHEMEALEANISIPFRFGGPRRTWLNPGFLRPASEMLRQQASTLRGASGA